MAFVYTIHFFQWQKKKSESESVAATDNRGLRHKMKIKSNSHCGSEAGLGAENAQSL